jgi:site-specific DNA recombinase
VLPELKIVDLDLWNAVNQRLRVIEHSPAARKIRASRFWERRRPQHPLTGPVRCGRCSGSHTAVGATYLACAAARNQGSCTNRKGMRRNVLELFVLETLKHHLMHPDLVKEFIAAFTAEVNRERQTQQIGIQQRRRELVDVTRRLNGLIEAIADGLRSPGLQQKLEELETRKELLAVDLSSAPAPKPRLHPNLAEIYRRKVTELEVALQDPSSREEALDILRGLIQYVEIQPAGKASVSSSSATLPK